MILEEHILFKVQSKTFLYVREAVDTVVLS